jgi:uncharacterized lipoprotein YmbA
VLGDPAQPAQVVDVQSGRPVVRLLPVSVPDYLDTREMLRRDGRNEVASNSTDLWAERLSVGASHALAAALATDLPNAVIVTDAPTAPPSRQIKVEVLTFDVGTDGRCLLTARWSLIGGDGNVPHR